MLFFFFFFEKNRLCLTRPSLLSQAELLLTESQWYSFTPVMPEVLVNDKSVKPAQRIFLKTYPKLWKDLIKTSYF